MTRSQRGMAKAIGQKRFLEIARTERQKLIDGLTNWQRAQVTRLLNKHGKRWDDLTVETLQHAASLTKTPNAKGVSDGKNDQTKIRRRADTQQNGDVQGGNTEKVNDQGRREDQPQGQQNPVKRRKPLRLTRNQIRAAEDPEQRSARILMRRRISGLPQLFNRDHYRGKYLPAGPNRNVTPTLKKEYRNA